jgi:hypothetical protein
VVDDPVVNTDWVATLLDLTGQRIPTDLDGVSLSGVLTGRSPAPVRKFYWHFPHYTNQGSRPSGAMRDGRWMYVEYYDEAKSELFDLSTDIGEERNLADLEPERVRTMRGSLDAWRKSVSAQVNSPNPNFIPERYRELYIDVDAGRFAPARATAAEHDRMQLWRKAMNAVLSAQRKTQK